MSYIEIFKNFFQSIFYLGIVEYGVMCINMDSVYYIGIGIICIVLYRGEMEFILLIVNFFWVIEIDWYGMLVKKLVVNVFINFFMVLYWVKNG